MRRYEHSNGSRTAAAIEVPPLQAGDKLTRAEFMSRWEQHPEIKFAELIGGVVYMPSRISRQYSVTDCRVSGWLGVYHAHTPGTEGGRNPTTLMLNEETPQPDNYLRILPEFGGQSGNEGDYVSGAPELIAEISVTSASYDLNQKKDLYELAGVREYVALLMYEQEIHWHRLNTNGFKRVTPGADMLWKSTVFPGLWLDGKAMLANDAAKVLATLQQGLQSPAHAAFVKRLARKRKQ